MCLTCPESLVRRHGPSFAAIAASLRQLALRRRLPGGAEGIPALRGPQFEEWENEGRPEIDAGEDLPEVENSMIVFLQPTTIGHARSRTLT